MINETVHDGGRHVAGKYRVTEECYNTSGNYLKLATASIAPVDSSLIYFVVTAAAHITSLLLNQRKVSKPLQKL